VDHVSLVVERHPEQVLISAKITISWSANGSNAPDFAQFRTKSSIIDKPTPQQLVHEDSKIE
jgi:hypothetical protein